MGVIALIGKLSSETFVCLPLMASLWDSTTPWTPPHRHSNIKRVFKAKNTRPLHYPPWFWILYPSHLLVSFPYPLPTPVSTVVDLIGTHSMPLSDLLRRTRSRMEASTACIFNHDVWNSLVRVQLLKMAGPQFSHLQSEKLCVLPPRKVGIQRRCR